MKNASKKWPRPLPETDLQNSFIAGQPKSGVENIPAAAKVTNAFAHASLQTQTQNSNQNQNLNRSSLDLKKCLDDALVVFQGLLRASDAFVILTAQESQELTVQTGILKSWDWTLFKENFARVSIAFSEAEPLYFYQQDLISRFILAKCADQPSSDLGTLVLLPIFSDVKRPLALLGVLISDSTLMTLNVKSQLQAALRQTQITVDQLETRRELEERTRQVQMTKAMSDEIHLFYQQFTQNISQCFWICDIYLDQTLFTSSNSAAVLGVSRSRLMNGSQAIFDVVAPQDRDRVRAEFHTNLNYSLDTEFRIITDHGELRWIWLRLFPFSKESTGDESRHIVFIADDVTERKQMDEAFQNRQVNLAAGNKSAVLEELASGIAHELHNPLFAITARVHDLKSEMARPSIDKSRIDDHLFRIEHTTNRIGDVLKSLKALARPLAANEKRVAVPLQQIIQDAEVFFKEKMLSKSIRFLVKTPPENIGLAVDRSQITQLLLNLLDNAAYAVETLPDRWIEIDWMEDADSVFIYVTDSGAGVPIHLRGQIFEPFFTTKAAGHGAGLGLTHCKSIAHRHGGQVNLDTMQLHTRFVVQLPKK